jgi:hypothetical protein
VAIDTRVIHFLQRLEIRSLCEEILTEKVSFSYHNEWQKEVFASLGLEPLRELGSGHFGTVYEAEYIGGPNDGLRVAVKMVQRLSEYENYQRIMKMRPKMPPDIAKHFPLIYDVYREPGMGFAIIMELLAPLPPDIADDIFDPGIDLDRSDTTSRSFTQIYGDQENVIRAVRDAVASFNQRTRHKGWPRFEPKMIQVLEKWGLNTPVNGKMPYSLGVKAHSMLRSNMSKDDAEYAYEILEIAFEDAFDISLPQGPDQIAGRNVWANNPSIVSLAKALEYVVGNGVNWDDMKRDNLGIRPSTNDIVILDLGLFYAQ